MYRNISANFQTEFLFGYNQENEVGNQIKYRGGSNVLVIYDDKSQSAFIVDKIRRSLKASGLDFTERCEHFKNPMLENAVNAIREVKAKDIDYILAVGEFGICSLAKVVAAGALYDGDFNDLFSDDSMIDEALPLAVISTTICVGKSISKTAVIYKNDNDGMKDVCFCTSSLLTPQFMIYNPNLCHLHGEQFSFTFIQILTILFRRYFTVNKNAVLNEKLLESTIKIVLSMFDKLEEKPDDPECLTNIAWASASAFVNPMLNVNEKDCINQMIETLVCVYDCRPQEASSVMIPAWFEFIRRRKTHQVAKLGTAVFNIPYNFSDVDLTAKRTVSYIKELFKSIGLPTSIIELNGSGADFEKILNRLGFPELEYIGVIDRYSETDCEVILSLAL